MSDSIHFAQAMEETGKDDAAGDGGAAVIQVHHNVRVEPVARGSRGLHLRPFVLLPSCEKEYTLMCR